MYLVQDIHFNSHLYLKPEYMKVLELINHQLNTINYDLDVINHNFSSISLNINHG